MNINSLLPQIYGLQHLTKTTNASVVGISETKLDNFASSSEIEIEGNDLLRFDWSWRGGGVARYVKKI